MPRRVRTTWTSKSTKNVAGFAVLQSFLCLWLHRHAPSRPKRPPCGNPELRSVGASIPDFNFSDLITFFLVAAAGNRIYRSVVPHNMTAMAGCRRLKTASASLNCTRPAASALLLLLLLHCICPGWCDETFRDPDMGAQFARVQHRPRVVVGPDGRQRVANSASPPYQSVVQLSMTTISGNTSCSGVLIEKDIVLTAASCVFPPRDITRGIRKPSWVYNIRVGPVSTRAGRVTAGIISVHVPDKYLVPASLRGYTVAAASSDFALVRLSQPANPFMTYLGRTGTVAYAGGVMALGFRRDKPELWSSRCLVKISGTAADGSVACDIGTGQEGGPILRDRLPNIPGSTPVSIVGVIVRSPLRSTLNRIKIINAEAEAFIRNVRELPSDPCYSGGRTCHPNALCTTNGTRATCVCRIGLYGDGYSCATDLCLVRGLRCSVNGYCYDTGDIPRCRCISGFIGDGVNCVRPTTAKTTKKITSAPQTTNRLMPTETQTAFQKAQPTTGPSTLSISTRTTASTTSLTTTSMTATKATSTSVTNPCVCPPLCSRGNPLLTLLQIASGRARRDISQHCRRDLGVQWHHPRLLEPTILSHCARQRQLGSLECRWSHPVLQ